MTLSQGQKIVCSAVMAVAAFAAAAGVPGCGNSGEGTVKVASDVRARIRKGPGVPPAAGRENIVDPSGVKARLRGTAEVK
jgi:hypothetical protein